MAITIGRWKPSLKLLKKNNLSKKNMIGFKYKVQSVRLESVPLTAVAWPYQFSHKRYGSPSIGT